MVINNFLMIIPQNENRFFLYSQFSGMGFD
jgi:hypothetical protein